MVSTARIERPLLHRGGSASTETHQLPRNPLPMRTFSEYRSNAPTKLAPYRPEGSAAWSILDCVRRATIIHLIDPSKLARYFFKGVAWIGPNCARRTTTVSSWAFREHSY